MGFVKSGPRLGFSGSIDGLTYSQMADGRTMVKQQNKKRTIPATAEQQRVMDDTALCSAFVRPLKDFIRVGFALEGQAQGQNANNAMVPELRKNAISGEGADRHIDLSKVLVTKGSMTPMTDLTLATVENGIELRWNSDEIDSSMHWSDHVVILAYFPDLHEARYTTSGPERHTGLAVLQLAGTKKGYLAHIYAAFQANDASSISNSIYLGQINW